MSEGVVGVLHRVVQQGRTERCLSHAQLGEDGCDGEWMSNEGIPALAGLAGVKLFRLAVGALNQG